MNISAPFIRRPVATSLLTAALLLYGSIAFRELPVASLPQVAYPVIQVQADLPGANADTQASAVATPLERMFGRIAGVNQMTSLSRLGRTQIVLQFDLGSQYRRRRPRRASRHQLRPAANCPPICPPIPPGARSIPPRRRSWSWRSLPNGHARSHVRRGRFDPGPEAPADRRGSARCRWEAVRSRPSARKSTRCS